MAANYLVQEDGVSRISLGDVPGFILLDASITPPSPPTVDPNGVQGSGGGPPKPRRTLHLEGYRPQIVDPREYFAKRKPVAREKPAADDEALLPGERPIAVEDEPAPDLAARAPDGLPERVEASIAVAERRQRLAEIAADDEQAMLAILFAVLK